MKATNPAVSQMRRTGQCSHALGLVRCTGDAMPGTTSCEACATRYELRQAAEFAAASPCDPVDHAELRPSEACRYCEDEDGSAKVSTVLAVLALVCLSFVVGSMFFGGSHRAPASKPAATAYAWQPMFQPGVHDGPAITACLDRYVTVRVPYTVGDKAASDRASRQAFWYTAHAYDACTGRDFEATAAKWLRAHGAVR